MKANIYFLIEHRNSTGHYFIFQILENLQLLVLPLFRMTSYQSITHFYQYRKLNICFFFFFSIAVYMLAFPSVLEPGMVNCSFELAVRADHMPTSYLMVVALPLDLLYCMEYLVYTLVMFEEQLVTEELVVHVDLALNSYFSFQLFL